jgi:ATP-binding cassette subfamily B (MDR/TAP) protein 1
MFTGRIVFKDVTFAYPAKPDVKVLKNFSMVFEPGQMTGICGETGSGKSTIIQLVERFYEPLSGTIEVDGVNINTLDLKWWRETLGFVGQEPVLFNTTIKTTSSMVKKVPQTKKFFKPRSVQMRLNLLTDSRKSLIQKLAQEVANSAGGRSNELPLLVPW